MWPVLALVLALPAMPLAARVHTRVHLSRAAVRMIDEDTPTSYADYMKKKQGSELSEKLEKGEVVFDANSDWQRTEGEGGKSTMSQGFASTDTPDFLPEEGDPRADIDFQQGMMGSQKAKQEHDHDPGVSAALEVNPEVVAGVEIDGNRRVEFVVPEERWPGDPAAQLAAEFDLGCARTRAGLAARLRRRPCQRPAPTHPGAATAGQQATSASTFSSTLSPCA